MPKVSICIPYHDTPKTAFFLSRLLESVASQNYKNYEIILTKEGPFARNHNAAIMKATGEIIKLMQMDDYFSYEEALTDIVTAFNEMPDYEWLISGTVHTDGTTHHPYWTEDIWTGNNRLGSVSTISFRRKSSLLFEEPLTWLVDCDWYYRMFLKYGHPILSTNEAIVVDVRTDRLTHTLSNDLKNEEVQYLMRKYGK